MICTREEDASADHFAHDAAHWPDVHVLLVAHAEDDLGRPVVPRDHVRGHHEGRASCARQTKVEDLQRAVRLHHNVAWLQVLQTTQKLDVKIILKFVFGW